MMPQMMPEAGESARVINARWDDHAWQDVLEGLRAGGRLKLHRKIGKAVLEGLPEKHPCNSVRRCHAISITRARRLEREGVIVQSGIDQYMLAPDFDGELFR